MLNYEQPSAFTLLQRNLEFIRILKMSDKKIITVSNLNKSYQGGFQALRRIVIGHGFSLE